MILVLYIMEGNAQQRDQSWDDAAAQLEEYPPSVKLVAKVLDIHGELGQQAIIEETLLPSRTVRHAVSLLDENGHLDSRHCWKDARKRLYRLELDQIETDQQSLAQ